MGVTEYLGETVSGEFNTITGSGETVSGEFNTITGSGETVSGEFSTITGSGETVSGEFSTITGSGETVSGEFNTITGSGETVSGESNTITGSGETVSGEFSTVTVSGETVSGEFSTITGSGETVSGEFSTITGSGETVSGEFNTITVSGESNTITVSGETVSGEFSTITGSDETVSGEFEPPTLSLDQVRRYQVQKAVQQMQDSIFSIGMLAGAVTTADQTSNKVIEAPGLSLEVQTEANMAALRGKVIGQREVSITLPASIIDLDPDGKRGSLMLANMVETFYPKSIGKDSNLNLQGGTASLRMTTPGGHPIALDPSDPATLRLANSSTTPDAASGVTLNSSSSLKVNVSPHETLVMTFGVTDDGSKFTVMGRFGGVPSESSYDFQATVEDGVLYSNKKEKMKVTFDLQETNLRIIVYSAGKHGSVLYFETDLSTQTTPNITTNRRRLLASSRSGSEPSLTVSSLVVAYWDTSCACWTSSPSVEITEIDEAGDVEFSSNFFGSFSLSEVIVAPNPIDFGALANFSDNLKDSPYVLVLHCVLLAATVLAVLRLRRVDLQDRASWAYLPLLSNHGNDQWHYAVSVHTAMGSSRRLDVTPCFSLIGQYGRTKAKALVDGVRENFKRGTTSNFIMSSNQNLGQLMEIKIWLGQRHHTREMKATTSTHKTQHLNPQGNGNAYNPDNKLSSDTCRCCKNSSSEDAAEARQMESTISTPNAQESSSEENENSRDPESNMANKPVRCSRCSSEKDDTGCLSSSRWRSCLCCLSRKDTDTDLENLDWKVDDIRITDLATGKSLSLTPKSLSTTRYTFLVQDWLSEARGDGRTLRHVPALDSSSTDSGTMFDVISRQKLFDEHLWLSVARRPYPSVFTQSLYSPPTPTPHLCNDIPILPVTGAMDPIIARRPYPSVFTRVQRFLCAVALLYLAMLANAMWYSGAPNQDNQDNPDNHSSTDTVILRVGIVDISYRTFYVGVLSSLIILLPALIMTCLFRKRRLRHTSSTNIANPQRPEPSLEPRPESTPPDPAMTASPPMPRLDSFADFAPSPSNAKQGEKIDRRCDSVNDPLQFVPSRDPSPISPLQVETNLLGPTVSSSSMFGNIIFVQPGTNTPDSGYRSPAISRGRQESARCTSARVLDYRVTGLSPVYPEFYNAASDWSTDPRPFGTNPAPNLTRALKAYSDSEQTYELLCTEQYNEKKRSQLESAGAGSNKLRPLPWWTIFIAYVIVFLSIGVSATFTLFYSLEWGGSVSLEWMVSLFFSTTAGTFLIEPLKILVLALILSCLLKDSAEEHLASDDIPVSPDCDKLKARLLQVARGLAYRTLLALILGAICLHRDTPTAHRQNQKVRQHLKLDSNGQNITSQSDIFAWLLDKAIPDLQPKLWSNGQLMSVYQQKFASDLVMYRMTPVTLTQKRVKGWVPCADNCTDQAYTHTPGDPSTFDQLGHLAWYSAGGYQVALPSRRDSALDIVRRLRSQGWLDHLTRAVSLETVLFNANTRLFTQAKVLFETPTFGSVMSTVEVESANLYPYTDAWDYVVLLMEIIFVLLRYQGLSSQRFTAIEPEGGAVVQGLKIDETIRLSESVQRDPNQFVDFSLVFLYHEIYSAAASFALFVSVLRQLCPVHGQFVDFSLVFLYHEIYSAAASFALFVSVLRLLGPLGVNRHLHILRETLTSTRGAMVALGLSFLTCSVLYSSCSNLLSVALGVSTTSKVVDEMSEPFSLFAQRLMYCLFSSMSCSRLSRQGSEKVKDEGRDGLDRELGSYVMELIGSAFSGCSNSRKGQRDTKAEQEEEDSSNLTNSCAASRPTSDMELKEKFDTIIAKLVQPDLAITKESFANQGESIWKKYKATKKQGLSSLNSAVDKCDEESTPREAKY
ncbi:hypothetical protein EGW08_012706 [Elysia chlorotica]|uniref:Polycystin domain-containing protein n=1 Tax=Elysia chlorotica TaxID=188477 RepID=A0A433TD92_ELYCH|nr:hypothetical protein EGW08_012706 [Elysia chlorotica]